MEFDLIVSIMVCLFLTLSNLDLYFLLLYPKRRWQQWQGSNGKASDPDLSLLLANLFL